MLTQEKSRKIDQMRTSPKGADDPNNKAYLSKIDEQLSMYETKNMDAASRVKSVSEQLLNYPFLKRARSSRWQITLSSSSYELLTSFLSRDSMLPLSTLLQNKCHIHVEDKDPVPYTPICIFDDIAEVPSELSTKEKTDPQSLPVTTSSASVQQDPVTWAVPHNVKSSESGPKLPYPDFEKDEFNKALLLHGFRRLTALETKEEIDEEKKNDELRLSYGKSSANIKGMSVLADFF